MSQFIAAAIKPFFMVKPSHSAVMLAFCALSASIAQANCTPLNSAAVTCSNGPDSGSQVTSFTGNSTITAIGWTRNGGYFQARDPGANGTVAFNGDGVTIINGGGGTYGAIHLSASTTGATGGNTSLTIKNSSISSTFAAGHGLASHANNATGSAEMTLVNTNVNMAASTTSGYGLVVTANGSGNATLRVTGGNITTANSAGTGIDHSYAISAHSGSGNVDAILSGGTITSTGTGARGINAVVDSGAGTVLVNNGNTIFTGGLGAHGIYASSASGDSNIINSGVIYTGSSDANGIFARTLGTGNASISNNNNVTINGASTALRIDTITGNAIINQNGGDITINGAVSNGAIYAGTNGTGSATVSMNGGTLTNNSTDPSGHGLEAKANGTGDATVNLKVGSVTTKGGLGIAAWTGTTGTGNAKVTTEAGTTIDASGTGNPGGIYARGGSSAAGTSVNIDSKSVITAGAIGIQARSLNGGNITITQTGGSITSGAAGIDAKSDGDISITNLSNLINTQNFGARGIYIENSSGGNINIKSSSQISTQGSSLAGGIFVNTTSSHINSDISGNITTVGTFSPAIEMISQRNTEGTASNLLYYHDGVAKVGAGSNAISLWGSGLALGSGEVRIGANTTVDASHGLSAVQNILAEDTLINIDNDAQIIGGTGSGITLGGLRGTLNTSGSIGSMNDLAIENGTYPVNSQTIALNNQSAGNITGYIKLGAGQNTFTNNGLWNLRDLADTDNDQVRDTLSVAVSDFGNSGNNSIINSGTIALLGDDGVASTLNNSGEYVTGYAVNTMALGGTVQGQILGVKTFTNSGTIDIGNANNTVGNVLIISGGNTVGTSGGGVYVADGGLLKMNTVLNQGGTNSQSDLLVLDATRLGSGATRVELNNIGGAGANTVDNGIEVIRVLDSSNSAAGVFKLNARTTAGLYEYDLFKGGVNTNTADGNWYLRSLVSPVNPVTPIINPESTVYLRNLNAASTMFMHTLHDRLGEPQFTDAYKTGDNNPSSAWVRVVSNHTDSTGGNGQIDLNTDTNLVHLGADIARWSNNGTDRWNIGVMGAYGQSKIDASPNVLGVTPSGFKRNASGKVDGYSVGGYATWYQNKDKPEGLYVDTWAQYGWYDNKVQGNTKAEESYNSNGWTASVEAGYAMIARDEGKNRQLMFEPQIQVAYNNYSSDDHTDASGTRITNNNANSVITRVGARLYSRSTLNDNGIQPFVEANWWYSDAKNSLAFNGETMSDGTPNSRYELKAGLQGEVAKNWLMWGHAGVQFGQNDFNRYEGMVGIKRIF